MSIDVSTSHIDANGTEDSSSGGALTMTAGGGTLSLGIETTSGDSAATEGEAYSVSYSTTMGSAAVAVGYSGYDANSNTSSRTDVTVRRWWWCFCVAEFQNLTGAGVAAKVTQQVSVVAIGTSVSF